MAENFMAEKKTCPKGHEYLVNFQSAECPHERFVDKMAELLKFICQCGKKFEANVYPTDGLCPECLQKRNKSLSKIHNMRFKGVADDRLLTVEGICQSSGCVKWRKGMCEYSTRKACPTYVSSRGTALAQDAKTASIKDKQLQEMALNYKTILDSKNAEREKIDILVGEYLSEMGCEFTCVKVETKILDMKDRLVDAIIDLISGFKVVATKYYAEKLSEAIERLRIKKDAEKDKVVAEIFEEIENKVLLYQPEKENEPAWILACGPNAVLNYEALKKKIKSRYSKGE